MYVYYTKKNGGVHVDVGVNMYVDVYGGVNAYVMCMCVYTRL